MCVRVSKDVQLQGVQAWLGLVFDRGRVLLGLDSQPPKIPEMMGFAESLSMRERSFWNPLSPESRWIFASLSYSFKNPSFTWLVAAGG